ncbi:Glucose and ribitol dehydrogenase-like protein [Hibiscus syriacus]|uniref:Glucose and ribitol dehydrogenase-like protein n=1 Tax=Hibiscus syriacus TaxID=106335 RepID=A0A6A2YBT3_HIBSY|nr:Glucose and ribitol dehydrogenase-like protein [Hibiscus syriacus]
MASGGQQQQPPQKQDSQPRKEHVMNPVPQFSSPGYKPSNKLQGKVALVTGGDSGIGRSVCILFAKEGATVAFTYVKGQEDKDAKDTLEMVKKDKTAEAKDPMAVPADLGFDGTAKRHVLKHMKEGSSIINTTSVNAYKGNATLLDYTATKGAIVGFIRGLALQLVNRGIRVNGVAPGPIWTPLIPASFDEEKSNQFGSQVPMKRAGHPIEVAPWYVFLACNVCSSYITGQVLHPNGGTVVNA